jgi:hypothetical protein
MYDVMNNASSHKHDCDQFHMKMSWMMTLMHHKFNMWWVNNENHAKLIYSWVLTFYTKILCIENTFNTWINVSMNKVRTYEWMNVTQILHFPINPCVKCVFNAQYQCVICTNYEWTNVTWFPFLSCEMLSLLCVLHE